MILKILLENLDFSIEKIDFSIEKIEIFENPREHPYASHDFLSAIFGIFGKFWIDMIFFRKNNIFFSR